MNFPFYSFYVIQAFIVSKYLAASGLIPCKLLNIKLHILIDLLSPVLHNKPWMRQRNDLFEKMMLCVQALKDLVIGTFAQTITYIPARSYGV